MGGGVSDSTHGAITAPDGWRLVWILDMTPQCIDCWNADGTMQWTISGEVTQACLDHERRRFLREHYGEQQLRMWL